MSVYGLGGFYYARLIGDVRPVPESLSLRNEESLSFFKDLRNRLSAGWLEPNRKTRRKMVAKPSTVNGYWDFCNIRDVSPAAALVIASEYDRIKRSGGWVPRAINVEKWNQDVRWMLDGIGFFSLCGLQKQNAPFLDVGEMKILKFISGSLADGPLVGELLLKLNVPELFENAQLYSAVIEGITNTRHHAYPLDHDFQQPHISDWWLSAVVDRSSRKVYITIYDHGVGIPATLPRSEMFGSLRKAWRRIFGVEPDLTRNFTQDGAAIALAMMVGRTRTREKHRGHGLAFMESLLDLCTHGSLSIYSRCGAYFRTKGGRPRFENRNVDLAGTLVIWTLGY